MPAIALIDSGFLLALYNTGDRRHLAVKTVRQTEGAQVLAPDIVLVEATYLARRAGGVLGVIRFLDKLQVAKLPLEVIAYDDLKRARDIMAKYDDSEFDFVDCCLMALAERLNITRIYTVDQRDFRMYRPAHCEFFELFP